MRGGALGGDGFASFEAGERLDGAAGFLLGETEVVESLQIQPELGARAEEMGEAQGGVAGDGTRAIQDLRDAIGGHAELSRQFGGAHLERVEFFGEVFSWMDSCDGHDGAPSDSQQSLRLTDPAHGRATRNKSATDR